MSNSQDRMLFQQEISDVKPLSPSSKTKTANQTANHQDFDAEHFKRKRAMATASGQSQNPLTIAFENISGALDIIDWVKPGVQAGVFKKFRLGEYAIQDRLDLRSLTNEQARNAFYLFMQSAYTRGKRCVLVIHGTNLTSKPIGRLKHLTQHWCQELDDVLAYHSAQRKDGGVGATYVLIRKNPSHHNNFKAS